MFKTIIKNIFHSLFFHYSFSDSGASVHETLIKIAPLTKEF